MTEVLDDRWSFGASRALKGMTWPPARPFTWLAPPSLLAGVASIADVFGTATWYDPRRLTPRGSATMLTGDLVMVGKDFWKATREQVATEGLAPPELPETLRLFDPDDL